MPSFEASVTLNSSLEEVFDFITRPANVVRIVPPEMKLSLVDAPESLIAGSTIEFEIAGFGPIQRLLHEITDFVRPERFTERQVSGPLKSFEHVHLVETNGDTENGDTENGDTEIVVIDHIEFEPPGGLVGFLLTEERILESLTSSFEHRHRELKRLIEQAD